MTPNSLSPSFGVVDYVTPYGTHKATVPTRLFEPLRGTGGYGGYLAHDGITDVDALAMWTDLFTDIAAFAKTTTTFNNVIIYQKASALAPSVPVETIPLNIAGASVSTAQDKATQKQWNFRTGLFGIFKLLLLDLPVGNFEKIYPAGWSSGDNSIFGALSDNTKAWQGRDGAIVINAISITFKLNDKLRKEYGMA
jgi:hypothetical protein